MAQDLLKLHNQTSPPRNSDLYSNLQVLQVPIPNFYPKLGIIQILNNQNVKCLQTPNGSSSTRIIFKQGTLNDSNFDKTSNYSIYDSNVDVKLQITENPT